MTMTTGTIARGAMCGLCGQQSGNVGRDEREVWIARHREQECAHPHAWRNLSPEQQREIAPRCIYCGRSALDTPCSPSIIGISYTDGRPDRTGVCCDDCDASIRATGRPWQPPSSEAPSVGAAWMACCGRWEEDENAIDWSTARVGNGGLRHWRCQKGAR